MNKKSKKAGDKKPKKEDPKKDPDNGNGNGDANGNGGFKFSDALSLLLPKMFKKKEPMDDNDD